MRTTRTRLAATLAAAAALAGLAATPTAHAAPRAGNGFVSLAVTRDDTKGVDLTESFVPPGKTPVVGDFVGDTSDDGRLDDILWYTPGAGGDALWRSTGDRTWSSSAISISGTYTPIVGYFTTGDSKMDIFWYAPGPTTDWLWDFNDGGSITKRSYNIGGTYTPIKGYFGDDGAEDIIWYAPGPAQDSWWDFDSVGLTVRPFNVSGTYTPVVGSFAGIGSPTFDYAQDILWYAPGTTPDSLWDINSDHSIVKTPLTVNGTFTPVPGDFTHDGFEDVIWYAPGTAKDYLWDFDDATGAKTQTNLAINGTYTPIVAELYEESDHRDDVLWFRPGAASDTIWDFGQTDAYVNRPVTLLGNLRPVLGTFERQTYAPAGGGSSLGSGKDVLDRTS